MTQTSSYARPTVKGIVWLSRLAYVAALIVLTYESLEPTMPSIDVTHIDKVMHALAYAVLTGLFAFALPKLKLWHVFLWPTVYGAFIEVAQELMPYDRTGSLWDLLANMAGSVAVLILWVLAVRIFRRPSLSS